jgi:hypothetical protein
MISVQQISESEYDVTVAGRIVTKHRVTVTPGDLQRFPAANASPEKLLQASFRFLLDREPNTSILSSFELPLISRYFPEYERDLPKYLG